LPLRAIDDLSYGLPIGFNVQFTPRNAVETYQMMASDIFAQRLASDEWSQQILFPEKSHAIWLPKKELSRPSSLNWIDKDLNYEQQVFCVREFKVYGRKPWMQLCLLHLGLCHSSSQGPQEPGKLKP
jgi:hypothetical protein